MKTHVKLILFLFIVTLVACEKEVTLAEYKFSDQPTVINCGDENSKLYNEALYSFEDDIKSYYKIANNPNGNMVMVYSRFLRDYESHRISYEALATPHTLEVFNVLKTKKDLWNLVNGKNEINYYGKFFSCIADNVQDRNVKPTLNALMTTHSMSSRMFSAPLVTHYNASANDKYLSIYVAFDLFYAHLFDIDPTKVQERAIDFNQAPTVPNAN